MGPIGSGFPQFGLPRLFAMKNCPFHLRGMNYVQIFVYMILPIVFWMQLRSTKDCEIRRRNSKLIRRALIVTNSQKKVNGECHRGRGRPSSILLKIKGIIPHWAGRVRPKRKIRDLAAWLRAIEPVNDDVTPVTPNWCPVVESPISTELQCRKDISEKFLGSAGVCMP